MGKLITFITLLIFLDLFFIATGQICNAGAGCSIGGILFNALFNLENFTAGTFFSDLIGSILNLSNSNTGIAALGIGATVLIGSIFIRSELIYLPISFTLALLASDFILIAAYLISLNAILGTFIMAPIILIYILTVVEWLRGKD